MNGGIQPTPEGGTDLVSFLKDYTRPPRVLVVEDEPGVRGVMLAVLGGFVAELVAASDGASAIGFLKAQQFDLVVMDLRLPDRSYREVAEVIEATQSHAPVVVMSGFIDSDSLTGLTDILDRPVWFVKKPADISRVRFKRIFDYFRIRAPLRTNPTGVFFLKP